MASGGQCGSCRRYEGVESIKYKDLVSSLRWRSGGEQGTGMGSEFMGGGLIVNERKRESETKGLGHFAHWHQTITYQPELPRPDSLILPFIRLYNGEMTDEWRGRESDE
ncbi:unnamed protein product [Pleuronectes platessa]|uniref:Uncharacterized protein n=1 Tax=Pleuronectes platessa TaxID=8262 RepID=A0A9N7Z6T3_PLEPL|nr:unnamed protein product [Pleuronectes platessa]